MFSPLLHPSKKVLSFPFSLGKKIIYLETQLKGELTDLFSKLTGRPCSHRLNRNRMMNTLRDSLENKSMFPVHLKKAFPLTLLGHSLDRRAAY